MNPGQTIRGYTLTNWLGSGGMGEVYQAVHQITRRQVAVKVLHKAEQAARFHNEAYIQASIQHPNIATLYEFVMDSESPCIIMEYVEGITLEKLIKRQGKLPEPFVLKVADQIVSAISHLHDKNIIHRDLKPGNIKINRESLVKLLDFGISKATGTPRFTQEGYIVGTAHYMAPEQFQARVSLASDCWAMGVLLYEMLTGQLPFDGKTETEVRVKIEKGRYTQPDLLAPGISKKTKKIISRLLRVNPQNRMTIKELQIELQTPEIGEVFSWNEWWGSFGELMEKIPVKRWFSNF